MQRLWSNEMKTTVSGNILVVVKNYDAETII